MPIKELLFDPKVIDQRILTPYLNGEFTVTDSTPPWIKDIMKLKRSNPGLFVDRHLIKRAQESGTFPDNTLHSSPLIHR